ncbi:MAG: hypothetical protein WBL19_02030 [Minisyncoccia bacterium]
MESPNVLPFFDDPGKFFGNCDIGDKEAPRHIVEAQEPRYQYHAILTKDVGQVSGEDFLRYTRRLVAICYRVYRRAEWELTADSRGPISFYISSSGKYQKPPYFTNDVSQLNEKVFLAMFRMSYFMKLRVNQRPISGRQPSSYAKIFWHCYKPDMLFVAARRDHRDDYRGTAAALEGLLSRKFLYVPKMAPTDGFSVDLGMDIYNREEMELPS